MRVAGAAGGVSLANAVRPLPVRGGKTPGGCCGLSAGTILHCCARADQSESNCGVTGGADFGIVGGHARLAALLNMLGAGESPQ
jgi:hypothetical protein